MEHNLTKGEVMSGTKIKRSQRKGYGRVCLTAFLLIQSVANATLRFDYFPEALTEEEREYMRKLKTRVNKDADLVRAFGWRLQRS